MLPSPTRPAKPKRTRTNVKQSKYGCLTCKARRIKCDEFKPTCRRCLTAKRTCNYARGSPPGPWLTSTPLSTASSPPETCLAVNPTSPSNRFVDLTCRVLAQGPRRAKNDIEVAFWTHTVPQLTQSIPSVRASAEALGASYDAHVLRGTSTPEVLECYNRALRLVQLELCSLQNGVVPCIVACLFLSCTEALERRLDKGLLHLQGALALMSHPGRDAAIQDVEGVSLLFQKLDLHSATYTAGRAPDLPPFPSPASDALVSRSPDQTLFVMLHSCYHFTSTAFRYKYVSHRLVPPELLIEQGRQLANLKQWLSCHAAPDAASHTEQHLVLRVQCLAALVYAANILEPRETAFDSYGPEFEEIISSIETLSRFQHNATSSPGGQPTDLPSFTPEMGIIHPLYFAALKYRDAAWRRRAIHLLRESGREGPWCGDTEAAVVLAVVQAEERLAASMALRPEAATFDLGDFAEPYRVNACWVVEYLDNEVDDGVSSDGAVSTGPESLKVVLVRCYDMDKMLREATIGPCQDPWRDKRHWCRWEECI